MPHESAQVRTDQGVELLSRGELEPAAAHFTRALELEPGNPLIHFNLGLTRHRQGRMAEAIECYRHALAIDAGLLPASNNLGLASLESGDSETAITCFREVLAINPRHVVACFNLGRALQMNGNPLEAIDGYRRVLELDANHAQAAANLGAALLDQNRLEEAEEVLAHALRIASHLADPHNNLGRAYLQRGKPAEARRCFEEALRRDDGHLDARRNLAHLVRILGEIPDAITQYRSVLRIDPQCVDSIGRLAALLEQTGCSDEADDLLTRGLSLAPGDVFLNLTAAKLERREKRIAEAIARLESVDVNTTGGDLAGAIHLELGQLYDLSAQPARAFEQFSLGNGLHAKDALEKHIDKHDFLRTVDRVIPVLSAGDTPDEESSNDITPVFAVGFPRSGTTLLDRVLGAHSSVVILAEKPVVATLANEQITDQKGRAPLKTRYLELVEGYVHMGLRNILIDKLPLNVFRVPFIHSIFPRAKIIFSVRHPFDVCLSCFMQSFEANSAMANFFSLDDTVALYVEAMGRWRDYIAGREVLHHVVRYEDLINDLDNQTRRLVGFLELPWEEAMLKPHEAANRDRWIGTPSYHQVTRAIYRDALDRWRRYAGQLEPYRAQLMPFVEYFGYEA